MMLKTLTVAGALLAGGATLALAQNGPPTGGQPPTATPAPPGPGVIPHDAPGPAVQSTAPSPNLQSAASAPGASSGTRIAHQTTKQHKKMYMSAKGSHHKATIKDNSRLQTMPSSKQ
jgi:hypothetical protein